MNQNSSKPRIDVVYILKNSAVNAVVFSILWALWAWWINSSHGFDVAMRAARTQASFTIINAFVYSMMMEGLFFSIRPVTLRNIATFVVPNVIVTVVLIGIHTVRGTPNVLATAAAPLLVVFALSGFYIAVIGPKRLGHGAPLR